MFHTPVCHSTSVRRHEPSKMDGKPVIKSETSIRFLCEVQGKAQGLGAIRIVCDEAVHPPTDEFLHLFGFIDSPGDNLDAA